MDTLTRMTWQDVADILLMSFLAHRFFLLFWGTTTLRIVTALVLLRGVQAVAEATGMVLTSWLFEALGAAAVLVIVVVFRNEIREVLIQADPVRLVLGRPHRVRPLALSEMAAAAFRLASTRTGALIVFQNRDRLKEDVREGVHLGGRFSPEVLESLFAKSSPVHDGAVVVRGDRIERVGGFLPLSLSPDLPAEFGTRHRAAVGLTERTDAVVVVVSEERGEVSVAHRGQVVRAVDPSRLNELLRRLLGGGEGASRRRGWTRELWRQSAGFALTLVLVSGLWAVFTNREPSLVRIPAHIDFRNLPEGLELRQSSGAEVEVHIRGKRPLVESLRADQVHAFLDLKDAAPGDDQPFLLGADNIELPPGLEVVKVVPSRIALDLERRVTKAVPVRARLAGAPRAGFRTGSVVVSPDKVRVTGPESAMAALDHVETAPVDLRALDPAAPQTVPADLVLYPASLRLAPGQDKQVRVAVELRPAPPDETKP